MKKWLILFVLCWCGSGLTFAGSGYTAFPYGAVQPQGWILAQMKNDLNHGLIGHFDEINNTVNLNLFVKKDRMSGVKYPKVGEPGQLLCWWSGEHEGYWKEAMIRLAYLTGDEQAKKRADQWVNELLASTDETGYIGIYGTQKPGARRYDHAGDNGELWTQGLINGALLSYYEFTGRQDVLAAVKKSVALTMDAYDDKTAFAKSRGGGVSHAVGYFDLLEWLYRMTGDEAYKNFTLKLRNDMEESTLRDDDLKKSLLLDTTRKFRMHGAHISEAFFVPEFVAELTSDASDRQVAEIALTKLKYHLTPTGAMACDEMIRSLEGNCSNYYEYCTQVELVNSLSKVMAMRNEMAIGDMIEKATFNALQGSRLPDLSGMSYLTNDNRSVMSRDGHQGRETYDVCHNAAACCALNTGRLMPFYTHGMWLRRDGNREIMAALYGPNTLTTEVNGSQLTIAEKTNYPFDDRVTFEVSLERPERFTLVLRKPFGVEHVTVKGVRSSEIQDRGDRLVIDREWGTDECVEVTFGFEVQAVAQDKNPAASLPDREYYIQRGPLVYAMPFSYTSEKMREHFKSGFIQQVMTVQDSTGIDYVLPEKLAFRFVETKSADPEKPFYSPVVMLKGKMLDVQGHSVPVELVPVGNTVMRRVSFPMKP